MFITVDERGRLLLESKDTEKCWETDKMSRRWYKACANETHIEELGIQPLLDTLKKLGGWPVLEDDENTYESFRWYDQVRKLNAEGLSLNYIMSHYIGTDDKNNSYRVWKLDQTSLGMSREYLIKGFEDKDVQHYYRYMVDTAVLLGADEARAKDELKESLIFEIKLANISAPREERRDANKLYNPTTVGEMDNAEDNPGEPCHPPSWEKHLAGLVSEAIHYKEETKIAKPDDIVIDSNEKVIVRNPVFFKDIKDVILETKPKVIANYMAWRVAKSRMGSLNKAAEEIKQQYNKALTGVASSLATWKKCVRSSGFNKYSYTSGGGAAGSMYVRKYFKPEEKKTVLDMISYIRKSFENILEKITWMDDETKIEAQLKLEKMDQFIAYPDELIDQNKVDGLHKGIVLVILA